MCSLRREGFALAQPPALAPSLASYSHNQLLAIPSALATLTCLSQLQVNNNRITQFRSLKGLTALQELWLRCTID